METMPYNNAWSSIFYQLFLEKKYMDNKNLSLMMALNERCPSA